jgi:hypothetical protein
MQNCMSVNEFAYATARRIEQVPHDMTDEEAEERGMISPVLIEMIMLVVAEALKYCLANNRVLAWRRVRNFLQEPEKNRRADTVNLSLRVEGWANRLGMKRENGDVRVIRDAIIAQAEAIDQESFEAIHTQAMFMTV